ncbi:MAG: hypothetical protein JNK14_20670 [Chitinophagaceae bacterium]|nr:hypothetical protein [Chitinophagaceae bacterium]
MKIQCYHTKTILLFFLFISICSDSIAQSKWLYTSQFNAGCHLNITYGKAQRFPGLRIFSGFSITGVHKNHLIVHYGP